MAVKPSDLEKLDTDTLKKLDLVEAALDAKLQDNYQAGSESIINLVLVAKLNGIEKLTYKMRTEILNRYKVAGWNVNIDPSQPDMIVFAGPLGQSTDDSSPNMSVEEMMALVEAKKKELGVAGKAPNAPTATTPFPPKSRSDKDNPYHNKPMPDKPAPSKPPAPGKFTRK